ncbi:hypothetical protein ACJBVY_07215 [Streptococcus suis]|uniref:hypothetical protein n=1 Tax=Streptococcus suis TaxID=1307 RepID=UPI0015C55A46|nr:hypothetical protein [Streptococcus suis]HEP1805227.1 hypothetical protein [Streptococcus suis]
MTYKNIILDDSILDVDSWFPQEAIDEIVEVIKTHSKTPIEMQSFKNSQYKLETFDKKNFSEPTVKTKEYSNTMPSFIDYQLTGGQVA